VPDPYDALLKLEPRFERLVAVVGRRDPFDWGPITTLIGHDPLKAMLLQITGQQISIASASAIFNRLLVATGGEPTPERLIALGHDGLRAAGYSGAKIASILDLADAIATGRIDLTHVPDDDETAVAMLSLVRGIGRWSAEVFLIAQFHRPDILPAGDLRIRQAVGQLFDLPATPSIKDVQARARAWIPYRTYAAVLLWSSPRTPDHG
jgi:DNA-3-methyladenine glycosylase II